MITCDKYPQGQWREEQFRAQKVRLVGGEEVELQLAEGGVRLNNGFWIREVRYRVECGYQVGMLSSDYRLDLGGVEVGLFAE